MPAKHSFLLAIALLIGYQLVADGVQFINGSWEEARREAKEQGKFILVDAYTDWCYWCKVQDKETFSRDDVGAFVNERFVPVKINFEQGVGIDLAMKYRVQGYPTLLFFNPEGRFVGRIVGYNSDPAAWMKQVGEMLDPALHPVSNADPDQLDPGFPAFYLDHFGKNGSRKRSTSEEVETWLDQQRDPYSEVVFNVMACMPTGDKWGTFFLEHISDYTKAYGQEEVADIAQNVLAAKAYKAIETGSEEEVMAALNQAERYLPEATVKPFRQSIMLEWYGRQEQWDQFAAYGEALFMQGDSLQSGMANSIAWTLYENTTDQAILKKAAGWMKMVVAKDPEYAYLDTYAALLFATEQLKQAEVWAKKAIEVGEAAGDDVAGTEELLEKIKAGKTEE